MITTTTSHELIELAREDIATLSRELIDYKDSRILRGPALRKFVERCEDVHPQVHLLIAEGIINRVALEIAAGIGEKK